MKTTIKELFKDIKQFEQKEIQLSGWIKNIRVSKTFGFIELTDGSYLKHVQIVFDDSLKDFGQLTKLTISSSIYVTGKVVITPNAKQPFELLASNITIECLSPSDYPLQKKEHSYEFFREKAHLRPRTTTFQAIFKIRSLLAHAFHQFFIERDFIYVHTPLLTTSDGEGAGEVFEVTSDDDVFGKKAFLSVTGQLHGECFAHAFRNIYTFGPSFRADNSHTKRHVCEFWHIEPEMAFADLEDAMELAEDMIKYIIEYVLIHGKEELKFLDEFISPGLLDKLHKVIKHDFERVTYTKAIELLEKSQVHFAFKPYWGCDIATEHEKYLAEEIYQKPVFITDYPKEIKAFYMKQSKDGKTVRATDLIVPGIGEVIGCSQREENYDVQVKRMQELGMDLETYKWYLDLRKYGSVMHSGFGIGFERILMYITGIENIRDVTAFPVAAKQLDF